MSIGTTYQANRSSMLFLMFISGGFLPHIYMLLEIPISYKISPQKCFIPDIIGIVLTLEVGFFNLIVLVLILFACELHNPFIGMTIVLIGFIISLIYHVILSKKERGIQEAV